MPLYILNGSADVRGPAEESPRRLGFYGMSWLREGEANFKSERLAGPLRVRCGQVVVMTPGVLHDYCGKTASFREAWVAFFGPVADAFSKLGVLDPDHPILTLPEPQRIAEAADMIRDGSLESLLQAGLLLQQVLVDARFGSRHEGSPHYPAILRLIRQIANAPEVHLSNAEMARLCHMGVSRFRTLFSQEVGTSPQRYCERQRMERACDLLSRTTLQVQEVAERLGYDDPLYFSKRFASVVRSSPRAYRNTMA